MMKKLTTLILTVALAALALTGCGSDPVADDLVKFMNTDMTPVNEKNAELQTATQKWAALGDAEQMVTEAKDTIMPIIDESIGMLAKIEPETDEVKNLKSKYQEAMEAYKAAFEMAIETLENDGNLDSAMAKMEEASKKREEFDSARDALAKEHDLEVQTE